MFCLCGSKNFNLFYKGTWEDTEGCIKFSLFECFSCHLIHTSPFPRELKSTKVDIDYRLNNLVVWRLFGMDLINKIKQVKKQNNNIKILDIGCNIGIFVELFQKQGWDSVGIDTDQEAIMVGKKTFYVDLRCTTIEKGGFHQDEFDVIVLSHTLEHIPGPVQLLKYAKKILKKGGLLVVVVPNIKSLPAMFQEFRGKQWYGYNPRQHIWHFTPNTLGTLLQKNDFKVVWVDTSKPMYYVGGGLVKWVLRKIVLISSQIFRNADQITIIASV